jgi:hypothetical protein
MVYIGPTNVFVPFQAIWYEKNEWRRLAALTASPWLA